MWAQSCADGVCLALRASVADMVRAINAFNPTYHDDFFRVIDRAQEWLSGDLQDHKRAELACHFRSALLSWGAGKRSAPLVATKHDIAHFLFNDAIKQRICDLAEYRNALFGEGGSSLCPDSQAGQDFDHLLISTLRALSQELFANNTGVTYPMKALLLLTGLMPAFDSQVKLGLKNGGMPGFAKTQFKLPNSINGADAGKITLLARALGNLYGKERVIFSEACLSSNVPRLDEFPGRMFDVLLFVQADNCKRRSKNPSVKQPSRSVAPE